MVGRCSSAVTEGSDDVDEANLYRVLSVAVVVLVSAVVLEGTATVLVAEE